MKKSNNQILLPRVIFGNRGDILSRWGLINGLLSIGQNNIEVFAHKASDLPIEIRDKFIPYTKYHNILLSKEGRAALKKSDLILWGGGLDMTDESSKAKLLYLVFTFFLYNLLGKKIYCVFQGAGPIKTKTGGVFAKEVTKKVHCFILRDEHSYKLIHTLNPSIPALLAGDAIFMPGFEEQIAQYSHPAIVERYIPNDERPVIAVNIRRWFHFSSDLIPFQLARKRYENRGLEQMQYLVDTYETLVNRLRENYDAHVLLISAYNPRVFSWEDDSPWLERIKILFQDDPAVQLVSEDLDMVDYLALMSKVDMAVSMRLHSSLTVMRFGNPAVNISYAPKGIDSFRTLGLDDHAIELSRIMQDGTVLWQRVEQVLNDLDAERRKVRNGVEKVITNNIKILQTIFSDDHE
ncbi:MAG: hypothetical protein GYA18_06515 [Chloroflexi bacterium]|nr:hypothetical protein [Chloroflexota bacterium]